MYKSIIIGMLLSSVAFSQGEQDPRLINGRPAKPQEFPEAVYVNFGGGRCSASVVGPETLLSAAHCMRNGSSGTFQVNQNQYQAVRCEHHPDYGRRDVDIALCKITKVVDVAYAQIPEEGFGLKRGDKIRIVGYGCTRPGGGGGNDGTLRVGDAEVTGFSGHDIVSEGAGLCFGDSGGPAYQIMADNFTEVHIQVSVNSKGNIRDTNYTARTYNATAREWMMKWAKKENAQICGINKDCAGDNGRCVEEKEDLKFLQSLVASARDQVNACNRIKP